LFNVISHPDPAKFATIRTDYVAIVKDHAAAMMLSIVEGWTNWLKEQGRSLWVDLSGDEFAASVAGLFSRKKFMAAGKLLEELGLLARKQKSTCDRTYQYLLQVGTVQERLNLLTFWNAAAKYIQLIFSSSSWGWLKLSARLLESLLDAIVPIETMQEQLETDCKVRLSPTFKRSSNTVFSPTNTVVGEEVEQVKIAIASKDDEQATETKNKLEVPGTGIDANAGSNDVSSSCRRDWNADAEESPTIPSVFPCADQLEKHGVKLEDKNLQRVAKRFENRLQDAVSAWLEWAKSQRVNKPTQSLISAIVKNWKPESGSSTREEINPPPPETLEKLKNNNFRTIEMCWGNGWCWAVVLGHNAVPWWQAIATLESDG
jgi:hypothetical protein